MSRRERRHIHRRRQPFRAAITKVIVEKDSISYWLVRDVADERIIYDNIKEEEIVDVDGILTYDITARYGPTETIWTGNSDLPGRLTSSNSARLTVMDDGSLTDREVTDIVRSGYHRVIDEDRIVMQEYVSTWTPIIEGANRLSF